MNILKNVIYFILSIQEKMLMKNLSKTLNLKSSSKSKKVFKNGCYISLDSLAEDEKKRFEDELILLLKNSEYSIDKLLNYIKSQGTDVFYIKSEALLNSIGENCGFIYPQFGAKALALSLLVENKVKFKTKEMFVITKENINKYYFIYHFYNWYSFKNRINGIDSNSIKLLNKYLYNSSDEEINKLQLAEIYQLKDAIKQDKSAIEFVFKLCQNQETSQLAFNKLKDEGANI